MATIREQAISRFSVGRGMMADARRLAKLLGAHTPDAAMSAAAAAYDSACRGWSDDHPNGNSADPEQVRRFVESKAPVHQALDALWAELERVGAAIRLELISHRVCDGGWIEVTIAGPTGPVTIGGL